MNSESLRIVFAGTPDFAAAHLAALLNSHHQMIAVYSQPDRPAGRGKKLAASPVKQLAEQQQIPVYQPITLKETAAQAGLAVLKPDLMIVVAYGLLLPQAVLDIPRLGCINVHASLLPRWRGAAPIQRAIEAGDTETGVCIMQMEAGLDTGPVLSRLVCPILPTDTGGSLHDRLAVIGTQALLATLDQLATGNVNAEVQNDTAITYAHKLGKEEAKLDFTRSAQALWQQIRAFNPFPVSWCLLPNGERLRVWHAEHDLQNTNKNPGTVIGCDDNSLRIACGEGTLLLTELQLPNRNRMLMRDIVNGQLLTLHAGDALA
ncbi:MAG TPA: methionyl-tRNA formyltransferase [Pseudomonadales bacterium]|nr:methionyl-tRNA formyltransferase [Pseudomonadales bacterium]